MYFKRSSNLRIKPGAAGSQDIGINFAGPEPDKGLLSGFFECKIEVTCLS